MSDASVARPDAALEGVLQSAADDPEDDTLIVPSRYRSPAETFDMLCDAGAFAMSQLEGLVDRVREALGMDDPEAQE